MMTMSYVSITAAIVAAAAMGATGAAWVLCGTLAENRVLASRIRRWESRVSHPSKQPATMATIRHHHAEVRRALRCTERLLIESRRRHVGTHRLDAWQGSAPPRRPVVHGEATILTHRPRPRLALEAA